MFKKIRLKGSDVAVILISVCVIASLSLIYYAARKDADKSANSAKVAQQDTNSNSANKASNSANASTPLTSEQFNNIVKGGYYIGDENAKVTLVEFSDLQCPYCKRFDENIYKPLKTDYIDTGKVRFIFRQFPLTSIHQYAQKAAEASMCAAKQGKYYEMINSLFTNGVEGGVDSYKQFAKDLNLNTDLFNTCLDNSETVDAIKTDISLGSAAGVKGTPTLFIDKDKTSVAGYSDLKTLIDKKL